VKGKDVQVEWMPFELRPYPTPTLRPESDYVRRVWAQSVQPLAQRLGVRMILPPISPMPHTHLAFEGYHFAKEHGQGHAYHHRVFTAYFQEGKDIGDLDVLTELARDVGLDTAAFRAALEARTYQAVHRKALCHAVEEMGITAVPTFVIGPRVLVGLQSKEALERAIAEAARHERGADEAGTACGRDGCG